jgi:hypothetical protein
LGLNPTYFFSNGGATASIVDSRAIPTVCRNEKGGRGYPHQPLQPDFCVQDQGYLPVPVTHPGLDKRSPHGFMALIWRVLPILEDELYGSVAAI